MRSWWHSPNMDYKSTVTIRSKLHEGVTYRVARLAFDRRMQLMRRVRELAINLDFLRAADSDAEHMETHILTAQIERAYVTWGLEAVDGLLIDGEPATPESLMERGPEDLAHEAIKAVRAECSLTDAERKN